ncbi:MAG: LuxR family transcriptional regulator [Sphingomicrobium sp.]
MRRLADYFDAAAATCTSLRELRVLLRDAANELGFDYFALLHHASLTSSARTYIRIDNYPADWVEELAAEGLARQDPVHLASRRTGTAFAWADLSRFVQLGPMQQNILERSRHFGLGEGMTVPVNVPAEPGGSCSFALRVGRTLRRECAAAAELIGAHAFDAARRLAHFAGPAARPHLSRREVQCLRLVAAGKSDWEISVILGISVETVRQYVKHARRTYGVLTRTQLVVLGLRDDWLSFEEAIDPRI